MPTTDTPRTDAPTPDARPAKQPSIRQPEPGTFKKQLKTVAVPLAKMWRLSKYPETEPYWARSGDSRFDDPEGIPPGAASFGVAYLAQDLETAFCESVIHENSLYVNGRYEVDAGVLRSRTLVGFSHGSKTSLQLVDLTGKRLKALGLNGDISSGNDYTLPQQWARAIHQARPKVDGIRYVSRQNNRAYCYAIFDRSAVTVGSAVAVPFNDMALLCKAFNVTPVAG